MNGDHKVSGSALGKRLRMQFLAGILVIVPIGAAVLILVWVFNAMDGILRPVVVAVWGHSIPGVGFGVTILLIYLTGVVSTSIVGGRLIRYGESLLARVPMFRRLYTGIKQILDSFSAPGKTGFMQVVLIEFPRKGVKAIGFITNEIYDKSGEKLLNILIPTSPNPTTGFLHMVKEEEVIRTRISVDDALKMIVSGGRMTPAEVGARLPTTD